jgi:hypothetical protein
MKARLLAAGIAAALAWLVGCGGHSARTARMRTALDAGNPRKALDALNDELGVRGDGELPKKIQNDDALLVLDRGSIQQSVAHFDLSKRDFEAADKAIDVLDLSHGKADDIARWVFSDSAGRYVAPPHEKLLVNTLNMVNYLELGDLSGAQVEARRLSVMSKYLRDSGAEENPALALGSMLAGFAFEKSGDAPESLLYYKDAFRQRRSPVLALPLRRYSQQGLLRDKEMLEFANDPSAGPGDPDERDAGDVLVVVGYGRVPHRVAEHVPIGLALTRCSGALSPGDRAQAAALAAQGLVTWVNFPTLAPERPIDDVPVARLDGQRVSLFETLDVTAQVKEEWQKIEGEIMAAAVTRTVVRVAVGKSIEAGTAASGDKNAKAIGWIVSLFTQAAMTAADVPDTRSWETLPARISLARVQVPAGEHDVVIEARGYRREQHLSVKPGSWAVVSLMALR